MSAHSHGHRNKNSKTNFILRLPSRHKRMMRTCLFNFSPHCQGRFWSTWAGDRKCPACTFSEGDYFGRDLLTVKECLSVNKICSKILMDEFNPNFV